MKIEGHLHQVLQALLAKPSDIINNQALISCLDLTLLNQDTSIGELQHLNHLAKEHQVAALCVYPKDLMHLESSSTLSLATVINFHQAQESVAACITQINLSKNYGASEIDYVVPYLSYLNGKRKEAINHATEIASHCKEHNLSLKIIVESGVFNELSPLYDLACDLLNLDINFLKTSTGKIAQGASFASVFTLLSAIKDSGKKCGIKISGGIKTSIEAKNYAYLAELILDKKIAADWFRIGASSLLQKLISI